MSSETFKCRCKCYEKCEPRRDCECRYGYEPKRECECRRKCEPKHECECKPRYECKLECEPKREYECECEREHEQGKNCEWFEKVLRDFYWSGFNDGCKKCGRKENECGYEGYEEYKS